MKTESRDTIKMDKAKVYFETYGCSYNKADTLILEKIASKKFEVVEEAERADVIVVNTCYVKTSTEHRMINRIKELTDQFPNKGMIIAGCMPKIDKERALKSNPKASLLSPQNVDKIEEAIDAALAGSQVFYLDYRRIDKSRLPKLWKKNEVVRIIQIGEGCSSTCSYCCTKVARGPILSFDLQQIIREVREGVREGSREFWLTAQDTSAYGLERQGNLAELIKKIVEIEGEFFVRIGMMNPEHTLKILDKLIEAYSSPKVFKFLHLPIQSGSNKILKAMQRRYSVEDAEEIVKSFRAKIPKITFDTDIIVGYPKETREDFNETIMFLERTRPDIVNLSKFGKRPGTSIQLDSEYNIQEAKERARIAYNVISKLQLEANQRWLGWKGRILIDEHIGQDSIGRNEYYKNIVVKDQIPLGNIVKARAVEASRHYILGEIL
ncbi:MAG: tRNA (N(6)-L-threonylcarbamoyladenosine(37)-C(2))-methylthiotransferase [Nitrososphaeria archaeon]